ncbi:glycoside hydrolase family 3 N-terminal domain-containing protein [Thalassomonas sp. M1454]|uniref:glycoside hydrolase family 3 N-terminal domain-containing protein n=1 Tax=Thalassomonas sp. M1454 TaxID=2594477 RepID=UPI00117F3914|nr:glycoside hydrolase family 3 N-terminal domain-containing protein [Thalassomonas sp. M1454]TRX52341.1 glycosyl hydrolase [Thalassomonas sp. M1454]
MSLNNVQHLHQSFSEEEQKVQQLLSAMTLSEKIGQMSQFSGNEGFISPDLAEAVKAGKVGSVLNEVDVNVVNQLQHIAVNETRLGIPLLIGRDVIHGFKTIMPIPLGQAASWSKDLVKQGAKVAAIEAKTRGINWTFAPMIDISRDPRWGRIAESFGEDPFLSSVLGVAMVQGFQGNSLKDKGSIAACAKHFAGYGASESGRDYNTANIPENELRNVYLPPFKAVADAGVATFMASFSDLNGVPASGNEWLMKQVLRKEWQYQGFVVSDWDSIRQLSVHGFTQDDKQSAYEAVNAGIDMEMVSSTYQNHIEDLIADGKLIIAQINTMVANILTVKFKLGLFENPFTNQDDLPKVLNQQHLAIAKQSALQSCVLLKNSANTLPINLNKTNSIAVIGPLANDGYEQLGTWIFDGEGKDSKNCLDAIKDVVNGDAEIHFEQALSNTRSKDTQYFTNAVATAEKSDVAILFLGEESILSGEAHCRSNIDLPGCQEQLIEAIAKTNTPIILVVMAGRPLTLTNIIDKVDSVLYAWHPGTMGGPAIADLLFGKQSPSGKLPVTFPRNVGQIPMYYAHKHTGKPASQDMYVHMDDIPQRAPQTSLGMAATHLDTHFSPLFPFGFGLSYTHFKYQNLLLSTDKLKFNQPLKVTVEVLNTGDIDADEIVQLYLRDLVGSVTRPVKELKGFERVHIKAGETKTVTFTLDTKDLAFFDRNMRFNAEPGEFLLWIGGNCEAQLMASFSLEEEH